MPTTSPDDLQDLPSERSSRRRGATMMEYLFVLSLILLAVIMAVGYLGQETKQSAKRSNDLIQKAMGGP